MDHVIAWLILPLLLATTSFGVGLAIERAARVRLPAGLAMPLGFAGSLVLLSFPYGLGLGQIPGAIVLVIVAATGLALGRERLPAALPGREIALAMLALFGIYLAPVALSGELSFAGYTFLGDTSVHFALVDYVAKHGSVHDVLPASTYAGVTQALIPTGYPIDLHLELATLRALTSTDVASIYQPFIAAMIALGAGPAAYLLRRIGMPRALAAASSVVALSAYLVFSYSLEGAMKELAMVVLILLGASFTLMLFDGEGGMRAAVPLGVTIAAAFGTYSAGGLPWFAAMFALAAVAMLLQGAGWRSVVVPAAAVGAVTAVAAIPAIFKAVSFYSQGSSLLSTSETGGSELGNLVAPLRFAESAGIWLTGDFRFVPDKAGTTYALIGVVAVLALFGVLGMIRRGSYAVLLLLAASLIVWLVVPGGPWIDAKLLLLLSPAVLLTALAGAWLLARGGRALEALVLAAALAIGVLASDAIAYHHAYLAPAKRLDELKEIGERFAGSGPTLYNEFEEYGKHYLRDMRVNTAGDGFTPYQPLFAVPGLSVYAQYHDLDVMTPGYVEHFPVIVMRRSPVASRPPAPYRRVFQGRYFEVWERPAGSAGLATAHLPLGSPLDASGVPKCRDVRAMAAQARRSGATLVAAIRPAPVALPVRNMQHPAGWILGSDGRVGPQTPGVASGSVRAAAGRYRVWLRGTFGRGVDISVDGRRVGHASGVQTPQQLAYVGDVALAAGSHSVQIKRGGGSLAPGNGRDEAYDTFFLEPVAAERLVTVDPSRASLLCGKRADWIETVRR
jgi:hypothetical protein